MKRFLFFTALFLSFAAFGATALADAPTTVPAVSIEQTRADFLKAIDRPRVSLESETKELPTTNGLSRWHFTYASEANVRVPGILIAKPGILSDGKRHPVAIVAHGTGGKKEGELPTLRELADKGFIAIAIDGRFHGERGNQTEYNAAIAEAYADGKSHPLYYDTVWDMMRLIDYLQTRSDVDPNRIGMMGISKGGIECWLTAAGDTRLAVAIPCISVQSFQWGLDHDGWHGRVSTVQKSFDAVAKTNHIDKPDPVFVQSFYDHLLPGIHTEFDGPKMLPLIAPRPLLVISGDKDPMNPVPGLKLCEEATKPVYEREGASEKFKVILQENTGHAVNKPAHNAAMAWFEKWLEPAKTSE